MKKAPNDTDLPPHFDSPFRWPYTPSTVSLSLGKRSHCAKINTDREETRTCKQNVETGSGDKNEMDHAFNSTHTRELTPRRTSGNFRA
jgi:hypothetical protein